MEQIFELAGFWPQGPIGPHIGGRQGVFQCAGLKIVDGGSGGGRAVRECTATFRARRALRGECKRSKGTSHES